MAAPPALPVGPMEIVFSFDTTGSMYGCLDQVKGHLQDMVQRLQRDIPGIRIAIFAHGDYCDRPSYIRQFMDFTGLSKVLFARDDFWVGDHSRYITKFIDFTSNAAALCDFVKKVGRTSGGDSDECYELVLHEVQTKLSWQPHTQKALVMIGDCNPHEPDYPENKLKLNWRTEADNLAKMGVRIYSVQCGKRGADNFYKSIADRTGGRHLKLAQIQNIFDFIMAICYREKGEDMLMNYENEVRGRAGAVHKDINAMFGGLRAGDEPALSASPLKKRASHSLRPRSMKTRATTVKKTATNRIAMKRLKRTTPSPAKAYQDRNIPHHRRENVPETNFMLKDCDWSPWQLAVVPHSKKPTSSDGWISVGKKGLRRKTIFGGKTCVPALYEFAVQLKVRGKLFVMYSKTSKGFSNKSTWESRLLAKRDVSSRIDDVIGKDCCVYVRRLVLKTNTVNEKVRSAMNRYDYAWGSLKSRKGHKNVTKSDIAISSDALC